MKPSEIPTIDDLVNLWADAEEGDHEALRELMETAIFCAEFLRHELESKPKQAGRKNRHRGNVLCEASRQVRDRGSPVGRMEWANLAADVAQELHLAGKGVSRKTVDRTLSASWLRRYLESTL